MSIGGISDKYLCPVIHAPMLDPVVLSSCKHVFERIAIEFWKEQKNTCPLCRKEIRQLIPQDMLREEIHAFIDKNPKCFDGKSIKELKEELDAELGSLKKKKGIKLPRSRCEILLEKAFYASVICTEFATLMFIQESGRERCLMAEAFMVSGSVLSALFCVAYTNIHSSRTRQEVEPLMDPSLRA